jgi:hypothetical protein
MLMNENSFIGPSNAGIHDYRCKYGASANDDLAWAARASA